MRGNLFLTGIVWLLAAGVAMAAAKDGARIFGSTCAACHGLDGHGGEHAPDIASAAKIRALTDQELTHVIRDGVPAAEMPAFAASLKPAEIVDVVGYLRVLQNQKGAAALTGNVAHGHELFFNSAGCAACHQMNGTGGLIGPDLTSFGSVHGEDEVRQAILEPSKNFDTRHPMAEASTRQGSTLRGVIRNEDNFSLQMQAMDGTFHLLNKAEVVRVQRQTQSIMPASYGATLSKSDLDDLIAYLIKSASGKPSEDRDEDDN